MSNRNVDVKLEGWAAVAAIAIVCGTAVAVTAIRSSDSDLCLPSFDYDCALDYEDAPAMEDAPSIDD